jgi:tripartite-type tricarboxylate transporter receptor subunit TctC
MTARRTFLLAALGTATLGLMAAGTAIGQAAYPNKPIKFIVPYAAGGLPDTVGRIVAQRLGDRLGQSVIVENRPGGNGVVAAQALAASPPDGYTFLVTDGSMFSINPAIYKNLPYDLKRDFVPVSLIARAPLYLAVHPKTGVKTFGELVALAKSKPGVLNYGSSGIGSTHHLTSEAMKAALGIDIQHVPFKGSGQSIPALIGGQVDMAFAALPSLSGFVKSDRVLIVASNAGKRSSLAPDIPVIAETIPGFDFAVIVGALAATGTPQAIIDRVSREIDTIARSPDAIAALNNVGVEPVGGTPADYAKAIQMENEHLAKAIKIAGLKPE